MGIMTILQIIAFVISNLPAMIKAIREILEIIRKNRDSHTRKVWRARLSRAMTDFKNHRDPERLGREINQMKSEFEREL